RSVHFWRTGVPAAPRTDPAAEPLWSFGPYPSPFAGQVGVNFVSFAPDGETLAAAGQNGQLYFINARTHEYAPPSTPTVEYRFLMFPDANHMFATSRWPGSVVMFSREDGGAWVGRNLQG